MLSRCNKLQFHHSGDQTEIFVMEIKNMCRVKTFYLSNSSWGQVSGAANHGPSSFKGADYDPQEISHDIPLLVFFFPGVFRDTCFIIGVTETYKSCINLLKMQIFLIRQIYLHIN